MKKRMNKKKDEGIGTSINNDIKSISYFLSILFCAFRACGVIDWHWFWIVFPIFVSWGLGIVALCFMGIIAMAALKEGKKDEK